MAERSNVVFLTSYALVLLSVDRCPTATVREIAGAVGLTERQVHRVLDDLEAEGYITRKRVARQNHYTVNRGRQTGLHEVDQDVRRLHSILKGA
jgi:DNA-binding MarR family transcriptional regulator